MINSGLYQKIYYYQYKIKTTPNDNALLLESKRTNQQNYKCTEGMREQMMTK